MGGIRAVVAWLDRPLIIVEVMDLASRNSSLATLVAGRHLTMLESNVDGSGYTIQG